MEQDGPAAGLVEAAGVMTLLHRLSTTLGAVGVVAELGPVISLGYSIIRWEGDGQGSSGSNEEGDGFGEEHVENDDDSFSTEVGDYNEMMRCLYLVFFLWKCVRERLSAGGDREEHNHRARLSSFMIQLSAPFCSSKAGSL